MEKLGLELRESWMIGKSTFCTLSCPFLDTWKPSNRPVFVPLTHSCSCLWFLFLARLRQSNSEQDIRKETLDWQLEKAIRLEPKLLHGSSLHHCTTATNLTSVSNEEGEVPPGKPIVMDVLVGRRPTRVIDGQKVGPRIEIESKGELLNLSVAILFHFSFQVLLFVYRVGYSCG